MYKYIPR